MPIKKEDFDAGLSKEAIAIVTFLKSNSDKAYTFAELCSHLHISQSDLSKANKALLEDGYTKTKETSDEVYYMLSAKGLSYTEGRK